MRNVVFNKLHLIFYYLCSSDESKYDGNKKYATRNDHTNEKAFDFYIKSKFVIIDYLSSSNSAFSQIYVFKELDYIQNYPIACCMMFCTSKVSYFRPLNIHPATPSNQEQIPCTIFRICLPWGWSKLPQYKQYRLPTMINEWIMPTISFHLKI